MLLRTAFQKAVYGARDHIPQAGCQAALDGHGEAFVSFCRQPVDALHDPRL